MSRKRLYTVFSPKLAAGLLLVLLAGCEFDSPRSALDPAGPIAQGILDLFMLTFWWGLFIYVIVAGILCWALWRYRYRADQAEQKGIPEQIHGNTLLEMGWGLLPIIILVIIGIPTVAFIFESESRVNPSEEALNITVISYQWWWELEYPEQGIVTANELHIPVGRKIVLDLQSADVIHSFWAPKLAGKKDTIPNQDNELWFIADEPGVYLGHCAEYCGVAHAYMRFQVIAHPEEEFEAWVAAFQESEGEVQQVVTDPLVQEGLGFLSRKVALGATRFVGSPTAIKGLTSPTSAFAIPLPLACSKIPRRTWRLGLTSRRLSNPVFTCPTWG